MVKNDFHTIPCSLSPHCQIALTFLSEHTSLWSKDLLLCCDCAIVYARTVLISQFLFTNSLPGESMDTELVYCVAQLSPAASSELFVVENPSLPCSVLVDIRAAWPGRGLLPPPPPLKLLFTSYSDYFSFPLVELFLAKLNKRVTWTYMDEWVTGGRDECQQEGGGGGLLCSGE